MNVKGTWNVVSITNATGVPPTNLADLVGGTFSFTDNTYELENNALDLLKFIHFTITNYQQLLQKKTIEEVIFDTPNTPKTKFTIKQKPHMSLTDSVTATWN